MKKSAFMTRVSFTNQQKMAFRCDKNVSYSKHTPTYSLSLGKISAAVEIGFGLIFCPQEAPKKPYFAW